MALMEKFIKLTPKQRDKFNAITTEQEIDVFLVTADIVLTIEERNAALEYIHRREAVLSDSELDIVSSGILKDIASDELQFKQA